MNQKTIGENNIEKAIAYTKATNCMKETIQFMKTMKDTDFDKAVVSKRLKIVIKNLQIAGFDI